jgi:hypothetical protein
MGQKYRAWRGKMGLPAILEGAIGLHGESVGRRRFLGKAAASSAPHGIRRRAESAPPAPAPRRADKAIAAGSAAAKELFLDNDNHNYKYSVQYHIVG